MTAFIIGLCIGGLTGIFISGAIHARRDSEVIAERE